MNFERQDIGLGLFVLGAAAAIVAGIIAVAGILKGETMDIHVFVDSFANMRVGTTVYVRGYRVGEIAHIDPILEPTLHFDVTMAIDADFPLYEGTSADIGSQGGLLGETVINLQLPDDRGRQLVDGDNIGRASTFDLSAVIARADSLAVKVEEVAARLVDLLSPEMVGAVVEELQTTLVTARESLSLLQGRFVAISDSLTQGMHMATQSLGLVAEVLQENRPRISSLLDSTQTLVSELSGLAGSARSQLDTQGPALGRNLEQLEAVLAELRILLADMNRHSLWQMLFKKSPPDTSAAKSSLSSVSPTGS